MQPILHFKETVLVFASEKCRINVTFTQTKENGSWILQASYLSKCIQKNLRNPEAYIKMKLLWGVCKENSLNSVSERILFVRNYNNGKFNSEKNQSKEDGKYQWLLYTLFGSNISTLF